MRHSERSTYALLSVLMSLVLLGCSSTPRFAERDEQKSTKGQQQSDKSNEQRTHSATEKVLLTVEGIASYYADDFHGKQTSNGETFDMNAFTAAHRTFPFGTKIRVTNLANNKSVIVRVNDRGPFKEGRIMDLSLKAAKIIDLIRTGTGRVRLEVLEWGTGQ